MSVISEENDSNSMTPQLMPVNEEVEENHYDVVYEFVGETSFHFFTIKNNEHAVYTLSETVDLENVLGEYENLDPHVQGNLEDESTDDPLKVEVCSVSELKNPGNTQSETIKNEKDIKKYQHLNHGYVEGASISDVNGSSQNYKNTSDPLKFEICSASELTDPGNTQSETIKNEKDIMES